MQNCQAIPIPDDEETIPERKKRVALENLAKVSRTRLGTPNKWTKIQESIADVYYRLGGADGLFTWVQADKANERDFYNHICSSLGSKIDINLLGSKVLLVVDDMSVSIEGEKPIENAITLDVPDDE